MLAGNVWDMNHYKDVACPAQIYSSSEVSAVCSNSTRGVISRKLVTVFASDRGSQRPAILYFSNCVEGNVISPSISSAN